jgi:transcriptional regulator NrdR family protein
MSEATTATAVTAATKVVTGIQCPACGTADNYAGKTKERQPDNSVLRKCQCNACGTFFSTIEVPVGIVEVKRRPKKT